MSDFKDIDLAENSNCSCSSNDNNRHLFIGHMLMLIAVIIGSFVFVAIKIVSRELGPISQFLLRNNLAVVLVLFFWMFRRPKGITRSWGLLGILVGIAFLRGPVYQILLNAGAKGVSVGMMAIIIATTPLHVSWLGSLILGERIRPHQIVAMLLAFTGAILPVLVSYEVYCTAYRYPLMLVFVALIGAMVIVFVRKTTLHLSPFDITTVTLFIAAILCLPLNRPSMVYQWSKISTIAWISIIFLVIGIFVHSWLMYESLKRLPAQVVSLYQFVGMVLTLMWGCLLMAEQFDWTIVLSIALVTIGLMVNSKEILSILIRVFTFRKDKKKFSCVVENNKVFSIFL